MCSSPLLRYETRPRCRVLSTTLTCGESNATCPPGRVLVGRARRCVRMSPFWRVRMPWTHPSWTSRVRVSQLWRVRMLLTRHFWDKVGASAGSAIQTGEALDVAVRAGHDDEVVIGDDRVRLRVAERLA